VTLIFNYAHKIVFYKKFSRKHKLDIYKCPFFKFQKTFTNFISLFNIINCFFNLKKQYICFCERRRRRAITPYPRIYLTPYIECTLWMECQDGAPGMPGFGVLQHSGSTLYMLSIIGIGIWVMLR